MDGLWLTLFGRKFGVSFWRDVTCYERVREGRREFVREQIHRFMPRTRRIIYRSPE